MFDECTTHFKSLGCSFVVYYKLLNMNFKGLKINSKGNPITFKGRSNE